MNTFNITVRLFAVCFSGSLLVSCEDFVSIDPPGHKLITETVFSSNETANAAVIGIYNELANAYFSKGGVYSVTVLAGLSSDIFKTADVLDNRYGPFQQNEIAVIESLDASANHNLWNSAYNIIYMCNSVIEGLAGSNQISEDTSKLLEGQVRFIRAFGYFYLVNIYGDVPLVLTTNYQENALAPRDPAAQVWDQVIADLNGSMTLLEEFESYPDGERAYVNRSAVSALLARVYLYQKNWEKAEEFSNTVIRNTVTYEILENLGGVFLKNSREAIWQISPAGRGGRWATYTDDGYFFRGNRTSAVVLSEGFVSWLSDDDKRKLNWISFNSSEEFYFPQKYKDSKLGGDNIIEYSMVLRLAEQYLIRAEARAMQGNVAGAIADVDIIRGRAGLSLIADTNPGIGQEDLLEVIMEERKRELFSEWGHRWFDLKRSGKAKEVLKPIKPLWQDTDVFYPIPGEERMKNPNLGQNEGY